LSNRICCLAGLGLAWGGFAVGTSAAETRPAPQLAVYRWANQATNVDAFADWLGGPLVWAEDFVGNETWDNVTFHCYFDVQAPDGHHQLSLGAGAPKKTEFPLAAARFKELFGT
jgi:hypothetical protein